MTTRVYVALVVLTTALWVFAAAGVIPVRSVTPRASVPRTVGDLWDESGYNPLFPGEDLPRYDHIAQPECYVSDGACCDSTGCHDNVRPCACPPPPPPPPVLY